MPDIDNTVAEPARIAAKPGRACRDCGATTGLVMRPYGPLDPVEYECVDHDKCPGWRTRHEQMLVNLFNDANPVGTPVRYWTGFMEGEGKTSVTRTPAQLLSGHTAVVWVDGEASCIALSHVAVAR